MGLLRGVARTAVVAGTASAVAGRVNHRQQQKWAAQDQQQYEQQQQAYEAEMYRQQQAQAAAPPPAAAPQDALTAQLQQLAQLRDQGILTEEEFSAKKAQILGI